eukprot:PhM_4_TR2599/c0_g1_i1/m.4711/K03637/moaC, CNX3; cyclic pyranopterin monophosphate synthase
MSTHVNAETGLPAMVDISAKAPTTRLAVAVGRIVFPPTIASWIRENSLQQQKGAETTSTTAALSKEFTCPKGPVLATAVVAGTMAVKRTSDVIPFCHPLPIDRCDFEFDLEDQQTDAGGVLHIKCTVGARYATGVEMEAMTGVSVAALTVYDMLKSIPKDKRQGLEMMEICGIKVVKKSGGKAD